LRGNRPLATIRRAIFDRREIGYHQGCRAAALSAPALRPNF
jgi:hypothetical protein